MHELIPEPTPVLTNHWLFEPVSVGLTTVTASEARPELWLFLLIGAVLGLLIVWIVLVDANAYRHGYKRGYDAAERAHGVDVSGKEWER